MVGPIVVNFGKINIRAADREVQCLAGIGGNISGTAVPAVQGAGQTAR